MYQIEKNNSELNWYEIVFTIFTILCSQLFNRSYIMVIIAIIYMIYVLLAPIERTMLIIMLLAPSAENLVFYNTTTIITAMIAICVIRFLLDMIKNRNVKIEVWMIFSLILLIYCTFNVLSIGVTDQILTTIKGILFFIFVSQVFEAYKKNGENYCDIYVKLMRNMGIGLICAGIVAIVNSNSMNLIGRFYFGENSTINVIGIQCSIVIIGLLYSYIIKATNKIMDLVIIVLCLFIAILTMSRTSILMLAIGITLFIIFSLAGKNIFKALSIFMILLMIIICSYYFNNIIRSYFDNIILRFQVDDISNGRYNLWEQTIYAMTKNKRNFLIGVGDYSKIGVMGRKNTVMVAHNFLIETWVIYGTIGLFFVIVQFMSFIIQKIPFSKFNGLLKYDNWISFVPILVVVAGLLYSHHFIGRVNSLIFIYNFLPIIMLREKSSKKIK